MLAWPALALLRASLPKAQIGVLVPAYTEPLAKICPYVNEVLVDPKLPGDWRNARALANLFRAGRFDAVLTLFSRFDIGFAAWRAGIGWRLAPATKLAQIFYNHRLRQRRSQSAQPEYAYNLDLVRFFLHAHDLTEAALPSLPWLHFEDAAVRALEHAFRQAHAVADGCRLVFVHAGHGGSADNLSLEQYAQLIRGLHSSRGHFLVLTAGPGEEAKAQALSGLLTGIAHTVFVSTEGLVNFAQHLQFCDVFVSGSTGPLHIAGALNCCTAAFYPLRRSSTALRWQTINAPERRLAFAPPPGARENDMQSMDIAAAVREISRRFLN